MALPVNLPRPSSDSRVFSACFPVSNPPASGLYTRNRMLSAFKAGMSSGSHARVTQLYIPWYTEGATSPISAHFRWMSTTSHAGKLDSPGSSERRSDLGFRV